MKENIKLLLQSKEIKLTNWERMFLESILGKTERNRALTYKQVSILNNLLVKNNLVSVGNKVPILTDNVVIRKLEEIVIRTNNHKDSRFQFFSSLLDFYNKNKYLSQKQKNAIINFDLNYSGKRWTAKPRNRK